MEEIDQLLGKATSFADNGHYKDSYHEYQTAVLKIMEAIKSPQYSDFENARALWELVKMCVERGQELIDVLESEQHQPSLQPQAPEPDSCAPPSPVDPLVQFHKLHGIDLPLIPVSPYLLELHSVNQKILYGQAKFEEMKKTGGQGSQYLATLRRLIEDLEMVQSRKTQIETDIQKIDRQLVTDLDPRELAQQLTLMDEAIYKKINPNQELKDVAWKKPDRRQVAPNVCSSFDLFNFVTNWVQFEILNPTSPKQRCSVILFFIDVAQRLSEYCSYNILRAVIAGLGATHVKRLKQTWANVPRKQKNVLDNMSTMMNDNDNYSYLRSLLLRRPKPALPFLGLFFKDLIFVDEAVKAGIGLSDPGAKKLEETLDLITYFQQHSYSFPPNYYIQHYFLTRPFKTAKDLYTLSMEREVPQNTLVTNVRIPETESPVQPVVVAQPPPYNEQEDFDEILKKISNLPK